MKVLLFTVQVLILSIILWTTQVFAADKVNINTADEAELDRVLLNIGPAKAKAIVQYRTDNGPFKTADELANVSGIGIKTVEKNRELIDIGEEKSTTSKTDETTAAVPRR